MIFLFTEIDHPSLFKARGSSEADHVLAGQYFLLEEILHQHGAHWTHRTEKGVLSAFEGGDPARAALAIQQRFQDLEWEGFHKAKIRMAIHSGTAERIGQTYVGPEINHTLKLLDTAWGGQILFTVPAVHFVPLPPGARLHDLGKHSLKDLSLLQNIYAMVHPDMAPADYPPLRSLEIYPNNLLPQNTSFFGREEEIREIDAILTKTSARMVSLLGPGGFGKTRLALQCAAEIIEDFKDGVFLVPLAPLLSDQLIVGGIANALKFFFFGPDDSKVQLFNHLKDRNLLLIMDNFEHIIEGAQLVDEILKAAPKVKMIVTTREKLRVEGETVFEVRGLRYPENGLLDGLEACSAAQLFIKSAHRVKPDFALAPEERMSLLRVCQLLEGMPLGLELSATWIGTLSLPQIAEKIESSRDFLATTMPHLPPRHRSLRAVFEYSWILLSEAQKKSLKTISIFKGGFNAQGARKVAGASEELLRYLENKSLLRKRPDGRFEIHELLKYYAKEKLFDDPAAKAAAMDAHCVYFAELLRKKEKELRGASQGVVLEELVQEMGNIQEAWKRAVESLREKEIADCLDCLFAIYFNKGWTEEAHRAFKDAADEIKQRHPDPAEMSAKLKVLLARILSRLADFENDLYGPKKAQALFEESLDLFKSASALKHAGFALSGMGIVLETEGDYKTAKGFYEKSLKAYRQAKDRSGITWALSNLGHILVRLNYSEEAQKLIHQSLKLSEADKDFRSMGYAYNVLGDIHYESGNLLDAKGFYQKGFAAFLESGEKKGEAWSFTNLGNVAQGLGDYAGARQMYQESITLGMEMGERRALAWNKNLLGNVSWATGDYHEAQKLYQEGLALYREVGDIRGEAWSLDLMGNLKLAQREDVEAERFYLQAYSLVMKEGADFRNIAWNFYHLGTISLFRGRLKEARERFNQALTHFDHLKDNLGQVASLNHLGETACYLKESERAQKYLQRAVKLVLTTKAHPLLVDVLTGVAQLLKAQKDERRAISLLMVALAHPTCRQQTKDRMVTLAMELETHFSPQEVEGGFRWAKGTRMEEVAANWLDSVSKREPRKTAKKKAKPVKKRAARKKKK